jgi:ketosteroid isomerase-like protein
MTATTAELAPVVQRFARALLTLDEYALTETSTPDLSWTIPGHGLVSGIHLGVPAVIAVATTVRQHGIAVEIEQVLDGCDGVTAILHESGTRAEKPLDVRVALTVRIRDSRVAAITGYISDVGAYDSYFRDSPREECEIPSPDVTAPDSQAGRYGHDGAKNSAVSSKSTGLRAALLRRPNFDEEGALRATRLAPAVRESTGTRT